MSTTDGWTRETAPARLARIALEAAEQLADIERAERDPGGYVRHAQAVGCACRLLLEAAQRLSNWPELIEELRALEAIDPERDPDDATLSLEEIGWIAGRLANRLND